MGMPCFSKPLTTWRQRSVVKVNPQQPISTVESGQPTDKGQENGQYLPPPPNLTPTPKKQRASTSQTQPQPWAVTKFLTPKPAPDRLTITPLPAVDAVSSTSRLSSPKTPKANLVRRVSDFFWSMAGSSTQVDEFEGQAQRGQKLGPNGSKSSLIQGRSRGLLVQKVSTVSRARTPSVVSDSSSMAGHPDGLAGLYALASLTAYETKLVPLIWESCLDQNKYYCEHVLSRVYNRHPELEDMLREPLLTVPNQADQCPVVHKKGGQLTRSMIHQKTDHVMAFLTRLIMDHELDYDLLLEECDSLGRTHAVYYYERGLQPYHWDAFAVSLVQEYKKTHMDIDMDTDEKELHLLAWTHFTTAIVSAIKDSFEDELQRMTPAPSNATLTQCG